MRFAMATNDGYQCVLEKLLSSGWELVKLFVSPGDWMHDIKQVIERALALGVEVQYSPIDAKALADLRSRGCTVLVVASYRWKIPEWRADLSHAINFHPSPLPDGRGPYPLVRAILEGRTSWAVSCHKISEHFDCGKVSHGLGREPRISVPKSADGGCAPRRTHWAGFRVTLERRSPARGWQLLGTVD